MNPVIEGREFGEMRAIVDRTFLVRRVTLAVFCAVTLIVLGMPGFPFNPVFAVPFAWLLLTLPFQWLLRRQRTLRSLQNVHAAFLALESVLVTYLIHRLGGVEWMGVLFYLFTVIYANFFLPPLAGYVVTGLALLGFALVAVLEMVGLIPHYLPFRGDVPPHRDPVRVIATVLVGGVGFYAVLAFTVRAFATMYEERRRALAELSARLLTAREEERVRIARRLHDELGQTLAAARWALSGGDPAEAERLLSLSVDGVRTLARELRPPLLDELGLGPALEALAESCAASTGIAVEVDVPPGRRFPPEVETAAYRVIQEALENAQRHAAARRVEIRLARTRGGIVGEVTDDGQGFDPERAGSGLGLSGMKEWVGLLGGELRVRSGPGKGTHVTFSIPCHDPRPDRG
ncbi:putative two-component sensor [Candidatus Bipolaricaulis anaerobius]|jgi:signal transduction histidine kinase|uniref:histidine kinase n=1 Tax=Candidatus Bipolaricaulis anaerobius TaxID=2026885 RepID=A0A2X3KL55_9BACT|nr:sensor histidine kinase [Candidatus Bipolaricaulis anaerobius]SQD93172.1 putative two-component sensor [Candidatus Bipolaricaulis anaerobius]